MEDVKVECAAVEGGGSEEASDSPADVRRRSVMQDEKIVQLAMHGRQSAIIVQDPLAVSPSGYTGKRLSPGAHLGRPLGSEAWRKRGEGSPARERGPEVFRALTRKVSTTFLEGWHHLTHDERPGESAFFDLDDHYFDARSAAQESTLRVTYPPRGDWRDAFDPNARWRQWWDGFMLVLVGYVLFVTPYELAFVNTVRLGSPLFVANACVDAAFVGDVALGAARGGFDFNMSRPERWSLVPKKLEWTLIERGTT